MTSALITGPCTLRLQPQPSMQMSTQGSYIQPDTEYLVRQAMTTGYQWSSLLVPPIYIAYVLARRGRAALSNNRVLRATWVGGLGGKSTCIC